MGDLKGLKLRTAGAWAVIVRELGAVPTVLPASEVYPALERHVIDATEYISPSHNVSAGLHNVAKYIILPGIHNPSFLYEAAWKKSVWDSLPKSLQTKLIIAGRLTAMDSLLKVGSADLAAMKTLRAGKNEFIDLEPAFMKEVQVVSRNWAMKTAAEQDAKGNPWMKRLATSYFDYQDLWLDTATYRLIDKKY
jgi:TRAP-type mannitol/chloroaromatic compound transport system substrate-binding protein